MCCKFQVVYLITANMASRFKAVTITPEPDIIKTPITKEKTNMFAGVVAIQPHKTKMAKLI